MIEVYRLFFLLALKKSQKDASNAVQKLSEIKDSVMPDQQSSSESSKLELALMHQWKSLFDFMENTFAEESRQLVSFKCYLSSVLDISNFYCVACVDIHFHLPFWRVHAPLEFTLTSLLESLEYSFGYLWLVP